MAPASLVCVWTSEDYALTTTSFSEFSQAPYALQNPNALRMHIFQNQTQILSFKKDFSKQFFRFSVYLKWLTFGFYFNSYNTLPFHNSLSGSLFLPPCPFFPRSFLNVAILFHFPMYPEKALIHKMLSIIANQHIYGH